MYVLVGGEDMMLTRTHFIYVELCIQTLNYLPFSPPSYHRDLSHVPSTPTLFVTTRGVSLMMAWPALRPTTLCPLLDLEETKRPKKTTGSFATLGESIGA